MIHAVEVAEANTQVARPLEVLVPLIKDDLANGKEAAEQAGMPYYRAAGEKMLEAHPQLKKKGIRFDKWIKENFGISYSHAWNYMQLARATRGKQNSTHANLEQFRREHLHHSRPSTGRVLREWGPKVDELVERARKEEERLREEHLTRQQEREAERKLAERLIDIGYRVLAKELHPDKGGSRDAMSRLSRVRDRLKQHA